MAKRNVVKSPSRRAFLRNAGTGVGAAGLAVAGLAAGDAAKAATKPDAKDFTNFKKSSYRETEHVKKAYETARF